MTPARNEGRLPRSGAGEGVTAEAAGSQGAERVLEADGLFKGMREIVITHRGERYRLRITQNDKLILTK